MQRRLILGIALLFIALVLSSAEVHPARNQIENHAYFSQPEIRTFCQERNIQVVTPASRKYRTAPGCRSAAGTWIAVFRAVV